jgi:hypothetical protein
MSASLYVKSLQQALHDMQQMQQGQSASWPRSCFLRLGPRSGATAPSCCCCCCCFLFFFFLFGPPCS